MTGQNASSLAESFLSEKPTGVIPVLSTVMPDTAVPNALHEALNARIQERHEWMALESNILQTLHPEMVRLTTEVVRNSLRELWLKRPQVKV